VLPFSSAQPGADKLSEGRARTHFSASQFEEDAEFVIDLDKPEPKTVRVLPREAMSEARCSPDLEVIQNDHCTGRRLIHRQEKSVFAFCGIGRAIHQDQLRALEALE
jgi:hypothetical protein